MQAPIGTIYKQPLKRTSEIQKFFRTFLAEYETRPQKEGDYQLTQTGWANQLNEHRLKILNKYRGEARRLKENYEFAKSGIDRKKEAIFFPKSNSFNETEKQTALASRSLAINRLSSGSIDKEAFAKEVEDNFKSGNIDYNGEVYNYLLNDKRIPLDTKFSLIGKLKEGFNSRGLAELNDTKEDLADSEPLYKRLVSTFQL